MKHMATITSVYSKGTGELVLYKSRSHYFHLVQLIFHALLIETATKCQIYLGNKLSPLIIEKHFFFDNKYYDQNSYKSIKTGSENLFLMRDIQETKNTKKKKINDLATQSII